MMAHHKRESREGEELTSYLAHEKEIWEKRKKARINAQSMVEGPEETFSPMTTPY